MKPRYFLGNPFEKTQHEDEATLFSLVWIMQVQRRRQWIFLRLVAYELLHKTKQKTKKKNLYYALSILSIHSQLLYSFMEQSESI